MEDNPNAIGAAGCIAVLVGVGILLLILFVHPFGYGGPPQLSATYKGTLSQTQSSKSATFILSSINEGQEGWFSHAGRTLNGKATITPALIPNGSFSGAINDQTASQYQFTLQFTIGSYLFKGTLASGDILSGQYGKNITNADHSVTFEALGTWKVTGVS